MVSRLFGIGYSTFKPYVTFAAMGSTATLNLSALNGAQRKAVDHPPHIPLQILAGPGSGKTRVLTSRIANLILTHGLPPSSICAVTFTNKAANEMKERLIKLIGMDRTNELKLGTFHALCAMLLRKSATAIGLQRNFSVCDADESKKIISGLLKPFKTFLETKNITLNEGVILSSISKAKAKGLSASDLLAETRAEALLLRGKENKSEGMISAPRDGKHVIAEIYDSYERSLRKSNSLDFDDLLLFGVKLLSQHDHSVAWCRHILVDEFQDTNAIQYELMKIIGRRADDHVTVVGDPDQSIYGWRSAEIANLAKMQKDFPATQNILLEQNYRSTAAILNASLAVVSQDKTRLPKSLHTSHPCGKAPSLVSFSSEHDEASFISTEIKRLVANMGGVLKWGDFAILLRFNALSRSIESALQKEGIPNRILGGHKFFERLEIKDLLAYLQLVDNPQFVPAFVRAINVPSRGIGEKTVSEIFSRADKSKVTPLEVVEKIHDGKAPDIKPPVKRKVASFVLVVRSLRKLASARASPVDILRQLLVLINYEDHLKHTQPDWESRWENVQELITFASEVTGDPAGSGAPANMEETENEDSSTPLSQFLQVSMLSSEGDHQASDTNDKVTIATCHAAKGLEWPVVMIPSVEQGTFPFYRCDDVEEERRLLYVACTRAQALLYLTNATKRMISGETRSTSLSTFISTVTTENPSLFDCSAPRMLPADRATVSRVLGRPEPCHNEVIRRVAEFGQTVRHLPSAREATPPFPVPAWHRSIHTEAKHNENFSSSASALTCQAVSVLPIPAEPHMPMIKRLPGIPGTRMLASKPLPGLAANPPVSTAPVSSSIASFAVGNSSTESLDAEMAIPEVPRQTAHPATSAKRRLGVGRPMGGYTNKKFKAP